MVDLLVSLIALLVIAALACAAGYLVGVLPFVRGVDLAEQRGTAPLRAGLVCAVGPAVAALVVLAVLKGASALALLAVPLLGWSGPLLVSLLPLGGRQGAHQA